MPEFLSVYVVPKNASWRFDDTVKKSNCDVTEAVGLWDWEWEQNCFDQFVSFTGKQGIVGPSGPIGI